jgi:hypothetical protein
MLYIEPSSASMSSHVKEQPRRKDTIPSSYNDWNTGGRKEGRKEGISEEWNEMD